ncbi:MAG: protein-L-isoaspartate O-methyltransferase [Alphaproteobacteria bacterium]
MDYATARKNMVESQLRTNRVTDERLLSVMRRLPREQFLPKNMMHLAYVDEDIPLPGDRQLSEPLVIARLILSAQVKATDIVLVIGGGPGYTPAILGNLTQTVIALESDPSLVAESSSLLTSLTIDNVVVVEGAMEDGWPKEAPYDLILIDGAVESVPPVLFDQIADGGRLVAVVRPEKGVGRITLFEKRGGTVSERVVFDASIPYLPGMQPKPAFVF